MEGRLKEEVEDFLKNQQISRFAKRNNSEDIGNILFDWIRNNFKLKEEQHSSVRNHITCYLNNKEGQRGSPERRIVEGKAKKNRRV